MPASHHSFLQNLESFICIGDYAFVHAGVRPGTDFEHQSPNDLLWIRRDFVLANDRFERIVVHGHTWSTDQPAILENRIGVDTGAYQTGVLTGICLEDGEIRVLQARN
jgi:serine/threonine protein phosphatase 1